MKAVPVAGIGRQRPRCEHKVHVAETDTLTKLHRVAKARRQGHDPAECGKVADFAMDGVPMCRAHAGQVALRALLEAQA